MRVDVLRAAWRDQRLGALGWVAAWCSVIVLYLASWPAVRHNGERYDAILNDLPSTLRALVAAGSGASLATPAGYLTAELLSITGPLLVVAMGVLLGTRAVAAEEEDGSLELLLAQPVSRTRVLLEKVGAACAVAATVMAAAAALLVVLQPVADLDLGVLPAVRTFAVLLLLAWEALALGVLLGAVVGRVGRSRAIAGGVALAAFLLRALGPSVPGLSHVEGASPFSTVVSSDPLRTSVGAGHVLTFVLPTACMLVLAVLAFRRRDLRLS